MSVAVIVLVFGVVTIVAHSLMARSIRGEAESLGLNKTRWMVFIFVGGIPAMAVYWSKKNAAVRRLNCEKRSGILDQQNGSLTSD